VAALNYDVASRRVEKVGEDPALLRGEADFAAARGLAVGPRPGARAVDAFAVGTEPLAEAFEPRELLSRDLRIVSARADIEQEIAVLRHRVDEARDQGRDALVVGVRVAPVVAEGVAHAARRFPLLLRDRFEGGVFGRTEITMRRQLRDDALAP